LRHITENRGISVTQISTIVNNHGYYDNKVIYELDPLINLDIQNVKIIIGYHDKNIARTA